MMEEIPIELAKDVVFIVLQIRAFTQLFDKRLRVEIP
jgi:hypothetical protein